MWLKLSWPTPVGSSVGRQAAQCVCRHVYNKFLHAQPLAEAGSDSLGGVELQDALAAKFGVELPATLIYDHPTPAALAAYLAAATHPPGLPSHPAAASRGLRSTSNMERASAPQASEVVSVSCRFPAAAGAGIGGFFSAAAASADLPTQATSCPNKHAMFTIAPDTARDAELGPSDKWQ